VVDSYSLSAALAFLRLTDLILDILRRPLISSPIVVVVLPPVCESLFPSIRLGPNNPL